MPKSFILIRKNRFLHFTCIINKGVARGSRRGHRDLGLKINKMPSAHSYLSNKVTKA